MAKGVDYRVQSAYKRLKQRMSSKNKNSNLRTFENGLRSLMGSGEGASYLAPAADPQLSHNKPKGKKLPLPNTEEHEKMVTCAADVLRFDLEGARTIKILVIGGSKLREKEKKDIMVAAACRGFNWNII